MPRPLRRPPAPPPPTPPRAAAAWSPPIALHQRAEADLAFVRAAVERSALFSAVPGLEGMLMGVSALVAAPLAAAQPTPQRWLQVWMAEAVVGAAIGLVGVVRKARRRNVPLDVGPARRFALGLLPPVLAGGALTVACVQAGAWSVLPALWMLCYGVGVLSAGIVSFARPVPLFGASLVALGLLAVASPAAWATAYMALAFGVGHVITGAVVARRYGG